MLPLVQLGNPGVPRHAQRRDNQDAAHLETVVEQMGYGGQGNGRLAQPHVEKHAALRMRFDELHAEALVVMQFALRKRPRIAGSMCVHRISAPFVVWYKQLPYAVAKLGACHALQPHKGATAYREKPSRNRQPFFDRNRRNVHCLARAGAYGHIHARFLLFSSLFQNLYRKDGKWQTREFSSYICLRLPSPIALVCHRHWQASAVSFRLAIAHGKPIASAAAMRSACCGEVPTCARSTAGCRRTRASWMRSCSRCTFPTRRSS